MSPESFEPVSEQAETTAERYHDPFGPDPDDIPDPMPDDLETGEVEAGQDDPMDGDAPTG